MKIQMVDLYTQYLRIKTEVDEAIQRVLESTAFINGPEVSQFAHHLSEYLGGTHVIPCANGTDGLQIAMMALGLQPGDEVMVPVHTYVATAEVIALLQLRPIFVDVDGDTFNLDINQASDKVTPRTKAIVPVHLYGQCVDMESILTFAKKNNLYVIEDTAQALGSDYRFSSGKTQKAGTLGTIGITSFFPSKNLGCFGDGGAIFTKGHSLAEKAKMIANHGQFIKYQHDCVGVNSRLDTIQAAILLVKLNYIDEYIRKRNQVADFYDENFKNLQYVKIPYRAPYSNHGFHQYTLKLEQRDELRSFLQKNGIPSMIYYPIPLHLQAAYRMYGSGEGSFPVAEMLSKTVISLPIHTEMRDYEMQFIVSKVKEFYE